MNKNIIILVSASSVLNPTEVKNLADLSTEYTVYLNSLLLSNWLENLGPLKDKFEIVCILSEKDKEFIPKSFFPDHIKILFYKDVSLTGFGEESVNNLQQGSAKTILIFHNTIGLNHENIQRVVDLAQNEEASIVIVKSNRDKIILTCSSGFDKNIFESILQSDRNYSQMLSHLSSRDILIHTLDGFYSVDDFEDIKKLYIELSKKESLSYCSPKLHESFNDLFIEYKDLINA